MKFSVVLLLFCGARISVLVQHKNHDRPRHIWAISVINSTYLIFYTVNVYENLWRFVTRANLAVEPIVAHSVFSRSEYKLYKWPKISLVQLYRLISQVSYYSCTAFSSCTPYVATTAVVGTVRVPYSRTQRYSCTAPVHQLYGCVLVLVHVRYYRFGP